MEGLDNHKGADSLLEGLDYLGGALLSKRATTEYGKVATGSWSE